MRPHLPLVDTAELPWAAPAPGIYSKILSRDPDTGARTALNRLVPAEGAVGQPKAHYHHTTEEILVLDGMMSFDRRVWLHRGSYVYHPAETVHGFRSTVSVETLFLSRVGRDLDFNYVDHPRDDFPYPIGATAPARGLAMHASPFAHRWQPLLDGAERYGREFELSADPVTGEGSRLIRYDAGRTEPTAVAGTLDHHVELFVIEGALVSEDGRRFEAGCYASLPPGTPRPRFQAALDSLLYVNSGPLAPTAAA
jgi:mannose-6-phosphate isomerase-like protein (cupin superfamily)